MQHGTRSKTRKRNQIIGLQKKRGGIVEKSPKSVKKAGRGKQLKTIGAKGKRMSVSGREEP